jgi:AcrR family transcriptional regulator
MQLTHESGRVKKTVEGPKGRTRRLLLEHASILLGQGQIASVAEVAQHAGVSRATAYRYFPTRGKMISAVVDFSLGPVRQAASSIADGRERIEELFRQTFPRLREYEPQLRAALQVSLSDMALERAGRLTEEPYRRGHRIDILSHAAMPHSSKRRCAMQTDITSPPGAAGATRRTVRRRTAPSGDRRAAWRGAHARA